MTRFFHALLSPFFRWWWAVLTGVGTLVGLYSVPAEGVRLGPSAVASLALGFSLCLFLAVSVLYRSYGWYRAVADAPRVESINRANEDHPLTLVLAAQHSDLELGQLVALYLTPSTGVEVCIAVGRVSAYAGAPGRLHVEPIWIAPKHQTDLLTGRAQATALRATRQLDDRALRLIERMNREEARSA